VLDSSGRQATEIVVVTSGGRGPRLKVEVFHDLLDLVGINEFLTFGS